MPIPFQAHDQDDGVMLSRLSFSCIPTGRLAIDKIIELVIGLGGNVIYSHSWSKEETPPNKTRLECRHGRLHISECAAAQESSNCDYVISELTCMKRIRKLAAPEFAVLTPDITAFEAAQKILLEIGYCWLASHRRGADYDKCVDRSIVARRNGLMYKSTFDYKNKKCITQSDLKEMLDWLDSRAAAIDAFFKNKQNFRLKRPEV